MRPLLPPSLWLLLLSHTYVSSAATATTHHSKCDIVVSVLSRPSQIVPGESAFLRLAPLLPPQTDCVAQLSTEAPYLEISPTITYFPAGSNAPVSITLTAKYAHSGHIKYDSSKKSSRPNLFELNQHTCWCGNWKLGTLISHGFCFSYVCQIPSSLNLQSTCWRWISFSRRSSECNQEPLAG